MEEGKQESTVELQNYAPIIQLAVVIWLKVEICASFCLFSYYMWPKPIWLVIVIFTLCVCVYVCVHMCTVNSLSCQIPLGEFEQIVFSIWWKYSGYRYWELASVKMTSKVLEALACLTFDNFWCGSRVWYTAPTLSCLPGFVVASLFLWKEELNVEGDIKIVLWFT